MNTRIWIIAVLFGTIETAYFGWNWIPQSDAEVVADMVSLALLALAWAIPE